MSRTEIDTYSYRCPCGEGTIEKTVASTDYVFPSGNVTYEFRCSRCVKIWRLANGALVLKASELPYIEASAKLREANKAVQECVRRIGQRYCEQRSFPTKKAEYEHLKSIGRYQKGYSTYLKWRREGKSMLDILVHIERSIQDKPLCWALSVASAFGLSVELNQLIEHKSEATEAVASAQQLIERKSP